MPGKSIVDARVYCIRISLLKNSYETVEELNAALKADELVSRALCVFHTGKKKNNPHVHLTVEARKSDPTMRTFIKAYVEPGSFSLVKGDGDVKMYSYLFHECVRGRRDCSKDDVMCRCIYANHKGWSEEDVHKVKEEARKYAVCDSKHKMIREVVHKCFELEKLPEFKHTHHHKLLFMLVLQYYDGEWVPSKTQMERYVTTAEREYARLESGQQGVRDWEDILYSWYTQRWNGV